VAAFKKVTGPEIHEMDRTVFKDCLYSKIHRKKKFNFTKKTFTPKLFDKEGLLSKYNKDKKDEIKQEDEVEKKLKN
jgi:hypothetical protein